MEGGKSLIAGQGQPKHLVICFSPFHFGDYPMCYTFECFPVSKLIVRPLKRKRSPSSGPADVESSEDKFVSLSSGSIDVESPEDKFVWVDEDIPSDDYHPRYLGMGFLHIGGGEVYAVGGIVPEKGNPMLKCYTLHPSKLSSVFRRISLSTPLQKSKVTPMPSMHGGKYFPLIEKINGLIYVLSGPRDMGSNHTVEMAFEVYNPSNNTWTPLEPPPFMSMIILELRRCGLSTYSHLVIDNKLHVSNLNFSATYDTIKHKWDPCNIFSECKLRPPPVDLTQSWFRESGLVGPPFPFDQKAIFYRKDIILCVKPLYGEFGVVAVAFKIIVDGENGEKALEMKLRFDDFPIDFVLVYLVDLGDDYFAAVTYEHPQTDWQYYEELAIVTFKVVLEIEANGGEVLVCQLMKITRLGTEYGLKGRCWRVPLYCFTM